MSAAYLGNTFDIHGGGLDLIFPHHENEIAQSRCAHGTPVMANIWMHNGFLQVEGEKMSKSLGNFFTIRELLETERFGNRKWYPDALRLNMLRTHYRKPIDWTFQSLEESEIMMYHWRSKADHVIADFPNFHSERELRVHPSILTALSDDLNTPLAIAELHSLEDQMWSLDSSDAGYPAAVESFISALSILGLYDERNSDARLKRERQIEEEKSYTQPLVKALDDARAAKNFAESDRIRNLLIAAGYKVKVGPEGTMIEKIS